MVELGRARRGDGAESEAPRRNTLADTLLDSSFCKVIWGFYIITVLFKATCGVVAESIVATAIFVMSVVAVVRMVKMRKEEAALREEEERQAAADLQLELDAVEADRKRNLALERRDQLMATMGPLRNEPVAARARAEPTTSFLWSTPPPP